MKIHANLFLLISIPGALESFHRMSIEFHSYGLNGRFWKAMGLLFLPFWMIPYTTWKLFVDVLKREDESLTEAKK